MFETKNKLEDRPSLALTLMIMAQLCFSLMIGALKMGKEEASLLGFSSLGTWEGVFVRSLIMFLICLVILVMRHRDFFSERRLNIEIRFVKWLALRGIMGALSMASLFYCGLRFSLSTASVFSNMSVFYIGILAHLCLSESLTRLHWICALGGFSGVLFIVGEGLASSPEHDFYQLRTLVDFGISIASGLFAAFAYFSIRKMKAVPSSLVVLSLSCGGLFLSFLAYLFGQLELEGLSYGASWLVTSALSGVIGQFLMTFAYHYAPAGWVSLGIFTSPIFSVLIDVAIFQQYPTLLGLIGIGLVVVFGVGVPLSTLRKI